MTTQFDHAEGNFVRESFKKMLQQRGFSLILESDSEADGWRAEFLGHVDGEDVVFLAHKPFSAPFATLCLTLTLPALEGDSDLRALMDCTSDFDVSAYFPGANGSLVHLTNRLLLSGINEFDFDFTLNNLLYCREGVKSRFGESETE